MIKQSLNTIKSQLSDFIKLKDPDFFGDVSNIVVVSNIVGQDGKFAINTSGQNQSEHVVICTLVGVEEESHYKDQSYFTKSDNNSTIHSRNPEIKINLNLLFSCYSPSYEVALSLLGYVIIFFQNKSLFTSQNSPQLTNINRFTVELLTLSMEQSNHLWGFIGAKYMPSVTYKMRMLVFQEELIKAEGLPIMEVNENFNDINTK